ncbi:hypothetical protein LTR94_022524 [Friedmanniomyces endolithicus]|nr:hypothetical protein LTR94_022524 [Friedmanniomyces endolithicus]
MRNSTRPRDEPGLSRAQQAGIEIGAAVAQPYLTPMQTPFRIEDPKGAAARRAAAADRLSQETGVDEIMIGRLVETFYARVRHDPLIGPIFTARVENWSEHLNQMKRFWASVILANGAYQGRPMPKHTPLPIDARHFDRWLEIFCEVAEQTCPQPAAALFVDRAKNIAKSLEAGVALAQGVALAKDERYVRPFEAWSPD